MPKALRPLNTGFFSKLTNWLPASATQTLGSLNVAAKLLIALTTSALVAWSRNCVATHLVSR